MRCIKHRLAALGMAALLACPALAQDKPPASGAASETKAGAEAGSDVEDATPEGDSKQDGSKQGGSKQDGSKQGGSKQGAASKQEKDPAAQEAAGADTAAKPAKPAGDSASRAPSAPVRSGDGGPKGARRAGAASQPIDGATYAVRLRDLEQRIDELKEQIRRSHTRLSLLSETILSSGIGAARAEVRFLNDMSSAFRLTKAVFVLDGAVQYSRQDDTGALGAQKEIPIFSGSIPPGDHTLQVLVQHKGHGYGVFSYLRGYNFEVKATHSFTVTEGKMVELDVIAWEKGGVTTPLEERPSLRFRERILNATGAELSASDRPTSGKGPRPGGE